jgi:hypothetical protein
MSAWESSIGESDEWYTPPKLLQSLGEQFDLDVAAPLEGPRHVPCKAWYSASDDGLTASWSGFVWMNPPFGRRNSLAPWLSRFFDHGNGIALTPDRTSAPWWQDAAANADAILFTRRKIQFERPDGTIGKSPGHGVTLWAAGSRAVRSLLKAQDAGLGLVFFTGHPL